MRIFFAFLIIFSAVFLWLLPITTAVYDFRTDLRTDTFSTTTADVTTANETLLEALYDDDIGSIEISSDLATDVPLPNSYNTTSQVLNMNGLTANTTRTLEVSYDVDALEGNDSINTLLDYVPYFWLVCIAVFAPAALVSIFTGKN